MKRPLPITADASSPAEGDLGTAATARQVLLEQSAVALGRSWADGWHEELRKEGRSPSGGWPGTMREARGRVQRDLQPEMLRRKLPAISEVEREFAARTAYASARSRWCKTADREAD